MKQSLLTQSTRASEEVFHATERCVYFDRSLLSDLKDASRKTKRKRARFCAHQSIDDAVHEMFIVHTRGTYVPPHRHVDRSESLLVLEGEVDIVLFDDKGDVEEVVSMGDFRSGKVSFLRMSAPIFHTFLIRTEFLVFKETTAGPMVRAATEFARWAPSDKDEGGQKIFFEGLENVIRARQRTGTST